VIRLDEGDFMPDISVVSPPLTIAILSSQCLVWLGLQNIIESRAAVPMVVYPHLWRTPDQLFTERPPNVFILDLETVRDAIGTLKQIREVAPNSKIVLLCGLENKDRTREAIACGIDGIIMKVQPPAVMLAVIEALYVPMQPPARRERDGTVGMGLGIPCTKTVVATTPPPAWLDALTEREREIIRLVGQGLSNKDIAYTLAISDSTVRSHMTSIFRKVGVTNRQKLLIHILLLHSSPNSSSRLLQEYREADELHENKESLNLVLPANQTAVFPLQRSNEAFPSW
jgi:DNA-binding NarL/FixJ family response regulator